VLYSFKDGKDGGFPNGDLALDATGNVYGTTQLGGDFNCSSNQGVGCGTVFKLSPQGKLTVLYTFDGTLGTQKGGLVLDSVGNLYGSMGLGLNVESGAVFKLDKRRKFTLLYQPHDPNFSPGELIRDAKGIFYGTVPDSGSFPDGYVFKLAP
jgi:uncharacterized repeat protein (TIGR03803 family)